MSSSRELFVGITPLISVFDMIESLTFYHELLGFQVVSASPEVETPEGRFSHWMWLRLGSADLMLNTLYDSGERPIEPVSTRIVAHGDTCLYIGCSEIDAAYEMLTARGLIATPPKVAPYGLKHFSAIDPDGYAIVFQEVGRND